MPARKHYVTNKNLVPEIIKSQEQGELTKEAIKMLISISERAIAKLRYKDPEDRRDCLAFAQMDLFKALSECQVVVKKEQVSTLYEHQK